MANLPNMTSIPHASTATDDLSLTRLRDFSTNRSQISTRFIPAGNISAFPMASRVVQKLGLEADPSNHLLMHAVGTNVSGQIASAIVGGLIIGLVAGI